MPYKSRGWKPESVSFLLVMCRVLIEEKHTHALLPKRHVYLQKYIQIYKEAVLRRGSKIEAKCIEDSSIQEREDTFTLTMFTYIHLSWCFCPIMSSVASSLYMDVASYTDVASSSSQSLWLSTFTDDHHGSSLILQSGPVQAYKILNTLTVFFFYNTFV